VRVTGGEEGRDDEVRGPFNRSYNECGTSSTRVGKEG